MAPMSPTANSSPSPASPTAGPFPPVSPISGASSRSTGGPASPKKTTDSSLVREVDLYLWNPLNGYFKKVLSYHRLTSICVRASGLCYDSSTNGYKAVMALAPLVIALAPFSPCVREFVMVGNFRREYWNEHISLVDTAGVFQWQTLAALAAAIGERKGDFVFVPRVPLQNQRQKLYSKLSHLHHDFRIGCQGLAEFAEKEGGKYHLPQGRKREIGFTFSFPVRQSSIDSGILIKWTKEWGAFSTGITLTQFDRDMDVESINPGEQIFEKTISGMYLDEIVRRVLLKMAEASDLFGKSDMEKLSTQFVLSYVAYVSYWHTALVSPFLLDESVEEMDEYCLNGLHGDEPPESELEHGINQYLSLYAGSGVLRCKFLQGKAMEGAGAVGLLFYLLCLPV
ncbi:hypothetical protein C3L33_23240, partial [Rhododendron williamsianum]